MNRLQLVEKLKAQFTNMFRMLLIVFKSPREAPCPDKQLAGGAIVAMWLGAGKSLVRDFLEKPFADADTRDGEFRFGPFPGLISCADLAAAPWLGDCAPGAEVASVQPDFDPPGPGMMVGPPGAPVPGVSRSGASLVWPTSGLPAAQLAALPVLSVDVSTDGSTATLERVRTLLEHAYPGARNPPMTGKDFMSDSTRLLNQYQQLADVVILFSLPIAGCSLAASLVGGLSERRRPFSLLRLSGVPLRVLRRVVALETSVPLLAVAVIATGSGLLAAHLFLRAQVGYSLQLPGIGYFATVLAGILVSLGIIGSGLPLLARITGPEAARND